MAKTRREIIKAGVGATSAVIASPFILNYARGETPVKIGFVDPLTGIYAALAANEVHGARQAAEELNAKGGILGRPVELLVEDSANVSGTGVDKALKLIDRDQVNFLLGDVNSAIASALSQVAAQKRVLHIVPGGHTDPITGKNCHWNVFRVCNTTRMETNANAGILFNKYGKKWYMLVADYAFGWTLRDGYQASLKQFGGTDAGVDLFPIDTSDFSSYLIKASAAKPDVLLLLMAGDNMTNCMKQIAQFGLHKQLKVAGAQQETEALKGLPPEARFGNWVFEWYWKQPGVPHVEEFVAAIRKRTGGNVPTARTWFGYAAVHSFGLVANHEKSLDAEKLARALEGMELPPEVKLQPNKCYYRKGDHQLMTSAFVGEAVASAGPDPEDLFKVEQVIPGDTTALSDSGPDGTGCKLDYPA